MVPSFAAAPASPRQARRDPTTIGTVHADTEQIDLDCPSVRSRSGLPGWSGFPDNPSVSRVRPQRLPVREAPARPRVDQARIGLAYRAAAAHPQAR